MYTLIIIGIVLFLAAIVLEAIIIKRQQRTEDTSSMEPLSHWMSKQQPRMVLLFLMLFLGCVIFSTLYYSSDFLPVPVEDTAAKVVALFTTTTSITAVAFFATQVLLFYFLYRFRKKENSRAAHITGNLKLEAIWIVIPTIVFLFLFVWGQILWTKITAPAQDDAVHIEVFAEQFNWRVRYAGRDKILGKASFRHISNTNELGLDPEDEAGVDDFIPIQMHVPKGKQVKITLRAKDVIHSFYVPYFHLKMDAVPGMPTTAHFTATKSTQEMRDLLHNPDFEFEGACAELCGRMHFAMRLILVVDEPDAFDAWCQHQQTLNNQVLLNARL